MESTLKEEKNKCVSVFPLKGAYNPYGFPILKHRTNSFIVEWQLPAIEIHDSKQYDSY